jgi:hypothetical protein
MIERGAAGGETICALGPEPDPGGRELNYILYMTLGPCEPGDLSGGAPRLPRPGTLWSGWLTGTAGDAGAAGTVDSAAVRLTPPNPRLLQQLRLRQPPGGRGLQGDGRCGVWAPGLLAARAAHAPGARRAC